MIIVECYLDEFFIKRIGFTRKQVKHEGGKGKVLEKVKKNKNRNVIGIIDEDPDSHQPLEMERYIEKRKGSAIKLMVRKDDDTKKIIQISQRLEHWLLHRARKNRISIRDFGFPDDPDKLHDKPHIERHPKFQNFLNELIKRDNEIKTLRKWIKEVI